MRSPGHDAEALSGTQVRSLQLELLDELHTFCSDHDLRFMLYAGSLLGAIRHEGFIPWDDDIDVMMPRDDFETLRRDFVGNDLCYLAHSGNRPTFPYPYAKLCAIGTVVVENVDIRERDIFGVNIDIFPYDSVPTAHCAFTLQRALANFFRALTLLKVARPDQDRSWALRGLLRLTRALLRPVSTGTLVSLRSRIATHSSLKSDLVSELVSHSTWRVPITWIEPAAEAKFEGRAMPIPARASAILAEMYGDYLTPPAEHERVPPHRVRAYRLSPEG